MVVKPFFLSLGLHKCGGCEASASKRVCDHCGEEKDDCGVCNKPNSDSWNGKGLEKYLFLWSWMSIRCDIKVENNTCLYYYTPPFREEVIKNSTFTYNHLLRACSVLTTGLIIQKKFLRACCVFSTFSNF